jgi:hypothetical protein
MAPTADGRPALWAPRLFHSTSTLREDHQLFWLLKNKRVTDFRDYKGVPIFAIVEVSPMCWNGRRLFISVISIKQQLTESKCLHNVCPFL